MNEFRLAMQNGYKLVETHEVYEYQVKQYDPQSGDGGIFV
jgi:hypothetical protein